MIQRLPTDIQNVQLDGLHLTLEEVVAVARYRVRVTLDPGARRRIRFSREVVEKLVDAEAKVYGLTTGFGSKRDTIISRAELEQLQLNLIRSHACGVGDALAEDQVRASILLRANTLARGNSGVRVEVIEALLNFLNHDVYPWIPSKGSLGASGDLAPLSHLALALCNDEGAKFYRNDPDAPPPEGLATDTVQPDYVPTPTPWRFKEAPADLFSEAGPLTPIVLKAKEGLAINNGTQVSTAIGLLNLFDAMILLESGELVGALSLESNKAVRAAFDPRLHEARPLDGQRETAFNIRAFTQDSEILKFPINTARLDRARKAISVARELLEEGNIEGCVEPAEEIRESIGEFIDSTLKIYADGQKDITAEEREQHTEAQVTTTIYRRALRETRQKLIHLYARVLETSLEGEVLKSRDFLADAVTQLQLALPETPSVQDDYSFRCIPQVLGAVRKVVQDTRQVLETEANSATDNPLIFPPRIEDYTGEEADYAATLTVKECREAVVSGGNFHGEAIAICLDTLTIALAELANISERRTAHLVDGSLSNGLPSLLVENSGLNNGLMIPQYVAASLVSENKVLCHPASVDSIPTCENTEDHVSMSPIAALKCERVLRNAESVVAIEMLTAWQGVYFRRPLKAGVATEALWQSMKEHGMEPVLVDRVLHNDMEWSRQFLRRGQVWEIAWKVIGA